MPNYYIHIHSQQHHLHTSYTYTRNSITYSECHYQRMRPVRFWRRNRRGGFFFDFFLLKKLWWRNRRGGKNLGTFSLKNSGREIGGAENFFLSFFLPKKLWWRNRRGGKNLDPLLPRHAGGGISAGAEPERNAILRRSGTRPEPERKQACHRHHSAFSTIFGQNTPEGGDPPSGPPNPSA